ncbi:hypothetical protein ACHAWF_018590 [Thalassiosira exigua]
MPANSLGLTMSPTKGRSRSRSRGRGGSGGESCHPNQEMAKLMSQRQQLMSLHERVRSMKVSAPRIAVPKALSPTHRSRTLPSPAMSTQTTFGLGLGPVTRLASDESSIDNIEKARLHSTSGSSSVGSAEAKTKADPNAPQVPSMDVAKAVLGISAQALVRDPTPRMSPEAKTSFNSSQHSPKTSPLPRLPPTPSWAESSAPSSNGAVKPRRPSPELAPLKARSTCYSSSYDAETEPVVSPTNAFFTRYGISEDAKNNIDVVVSASMDATTEEPLPDVVDTNTGSDSGLEDESSSIDEAPSIEVPEGNYAPELQVKGQSSNFFGRVFCALCRPDDDDFVGLAVASSLERKSGRKAQRRHRSSRASNSAIVGSFVADASAEKRTSCRSRSDIKESRDNVSDEDSNNNSDHGTDDGSDNGSDDDFGGCSEDGSRSDGLPSPHWSYVSCDDAATESSSFDNSEA